MGCRSITLQACLGMISLFFWICAVSLIVIGAIILGEYGNISELAHSTEILVPSCILIGAGVFLFIVGLLGCIGGLKKHKTTLCVFFVLTLLVLIGEIAAVAFGYYYRDQARDKLTDKLHNMIKDCENRTNSNNAECDEVKFIQQTFECCGADTYKDWFKWSAGNYSIPQSCCRHDGCATPERGTNTTIANQTIYTDGCVTKTVNRIEDYFAWIFIGTIAVVVLQVFGLVATCITLFRSDETPYLMLDSQGYRV